MKSDSDLLQEFAGQRTQDAFAELVRRHVDLVYSAALRQVNGDVHLARDVAQRVFIDFARKAKPLSAHASLVGWLYTSAHHAAANAVRSERRRRTHEQEAFAMQRIDAEENNRPDWERLRPVLDEAMLELNEADRDAVLRRFFSGESFATIGEALELSHDAARKRVERALDRLQRVLARRGVTSSASALGLVISQHAVLAAPAGFGAVVTHAAFSSASGLLAASGVFLMNKLTVGVTAAVVAGLIALVLVEGDSLSQSERELGLKRNEVATLKASLVQEEQTLAEQETKLRELSAATITEAPSAAIEQVPPITPSERVQLDSTYAGLFRRLQLDREKLAALKDLLVLRQRRSDRELRDLLRSRGIDVYTWTWDDLNAARLIAARDIDEKIGMLLGEEGLRYVQNYEYTTRYRATFMEVEKILAPLGAPLSPDQTDQLVAWTAAEADQSLAARHVISDNLVTKAAAILTPLQLAKLKLFQANLNARLQLTADNQAAAFEGKLRLLPSSQREFTEWATKSAKTSSASAPAP